MTLVNNVILYPTHGAGSVCGKNLNQDKIGTIGNQKGTNYALRASMSKNKFLQEVTQGLLPPPIYFL